ncbi:hypothetical protein [Deinococcus koreensis]|uniref:Uncharacterized protein n=1 Tax=Deinococcus koreensis TaxID=2054903 RepID=A0A2K3UWC0_9DEIO|nr:hypothetical protein [Deinococcus koreensis]PNY80834.1 hypothetical protein CVO96_05120 [Deinococcus koreensis]
MRSSDANWLLSEELQSEAVAQTDGAAQARSVVALLNGGGLYTRTALLVLPLGWLGREGEISARLGIAHVHYQQWKLERISPDQSYLLYSAERLIAELDALCGEPYPYGTLLVSVFDLPLAALVPAELRKFWNYLFGTFSKRPRGVMLALPDGAPILPTETDLEGWQAAGRLARWEI